MLSIPTGEKACMAAPRATLLGNLVTSRKAEDTGSG
jgi:hypothetical protein